MVFKQGVRGDDVIRLQKGLSAMGYHTGPADGVFGDMTEEAVSNFQKDMGLLSDGVAGSSTLEAYNRVLSTLERIVPVCLASLGLDPIEDFTIEVPKDPEFTPTTGGPKNTWEQVPADKVEKVAGYKSLRLRDDVAARYRALYDEVQSLGGVITTAGGRRALSSRASPSRSKTSMHYVGRAFDLSLGSGMQNPHKDPYVVVRDEEEPSGRKWIVYCKTTNEDVPEMKVEACWASTMKNAKGKRYTQLHTKTYNGRLINFTELAAKHGFERISCRRSFIRGGSYSGAEWWHFQNEDGLRKGTTTFGEELLRTYTLDEARRFVYWAEAKGRVFGVNWF